MTNRQTKYLRFHRSQHLVGEISTMFINTNKKIEIVLGHNLVRGRILNMYPYDAILVMVKRNLF